LDKNNRISISSRQDSQSNKDKLNKQAADTLLNTVRSSPSSPPKEQQQSIWADFRNYLVNEGQRQHSVRNKVGYAKRFHYILDSKDARDLLKLSHGSKVHTMKALASLSKFLGRYDEWLDIVKRHQLKWSKPDNSLKAFKNIFDSQSEGKNLESMIKWIRDVSSSLPVEYRNVLLFNTLTGLRPDESQKAIHLIKTKEKEYIDKDRELLKHYQYPSMFLRQTKNAYITIINPAIVGFAKDTPNKDNYYPSLRKRIAITNNYDMNMYFCRKVFATDLRNSGIEPEIINLLQGRISSSVFVNHYYRPDINDTIRNKIKPALISLLDKIVK
jgi:hypothetical protein